MLEEAAEVDEREDAELGEARGDELPAELGDRRSRRERLRRCKEELEAQHAAELHAHEDNLAWRERWEAEHGRKLAGRKPTPPAPDALEKAKINTTDLDSRSMRRAGANALQGYNAQVLVSPEQVILAADLTQSAADAPELAPMVAQGHRGAGGSRGRRADRHRLGRRRLLELTADLRDPRQGNRGSHTHPQPAAHRAPQGPSALPAKTAARRAGLCQHQVHPQSRSLPTAGVSGLQGRVRLIAATHNLLKLWRAGFAGSGPRLAGSMPARGLSVAGSSFEPDPTDPDPLDPGELPRGERDSLNSGGCATAASPGKSAVPAASIAASVAAIPQSGPSLLASPSSSPHPLAAETYPRPPGRGLTLDSVAADLG
jgi:hypothetical protein